MLTRSSLTIRLHPNDDVVIARAQLVGGTQLLDEKITISGLVPPGHKVATRAIKAGEPVRRSMACQSQTIPRPGVSGGIA